jgi:hypothetical protein
MNIKAAFVFLLLPLSGLAQTIELENGAFKVAGWHADPAAAKEWPSIFRVSVAQKQAEAMLGTYSVEDGTLVFHPRFPLASGVRYRAVFDAPGVARQEAFFDGPKRLDVPAAKVAAVYPSANVLPSNTLRMYIYFSAPMSRGEAWKHIHVLDESGSPIELPFLVIDQELWDAGYQRLTLLFDPGRIKRGLVLNEQVGPPIVEGKRYTLVIDGQWRDSQGRPLGEDFRKTFQGGPSDRNPPFLKLWQVSAPKPGTLDPLVIDFPKAMDYGMVQRLIALPGVAGSVTVDREETRWRFTPREPWTPGAYKLIVDAKLEDITGNRINRAFDVDRTLPAADRTAEATESLLFQVR